MQIAAVANGDNSEKAAIESQLADLAQRGWQLTEAVQQLWAGERNVETLQQGADTNRPQAL